MIIPVFSVFLRDGNKIVFTPVFRILYGYYRFAVVRFFFQLILGITRFKRNFRFVAFFFYFQLELIDFSAVFHDFIGVRLLVVFYFLLEFNVSVFIRVCDEFDFHFAFAVFFLDFAFAFYNIFVISDDEFTVYFAFALIVIVVTVTAVIFVIMNLVVDIVYAYLDPRIKYGAKEEG